MIDKKSSPEIFSVVPSMEDNSKPKKRKKIKTKVQEPDLNETSEKRPMSQQKVKGQETPQSEVKKVSISKDSQLDMSREGLVQSTKAKKKKRKLDDTNKGEHEQCLKSGDQQLQVTMETTSTLATKHDEDKSSAKTKKMTKKKKKEIHGSDKADLLSDAQQDMSEENQEQCKTRETSETTTHHSGSDASMSIQKDVGGSRNDSSASKDKKKKRKKDKKRLQNTTDVETTEAKSEDGKAEMAAIAYLRKWKEDRAAWNFQKVRQTWLLKNVYNCDKLSCEDFPVLLEYLEGLKGNSRQLTVKQAQAIIDKADAEEAGSDEVPEEQVSRARQILQFLSE